MEDEISKPVQPFDRQREYIATQIVAEYLRDYFKCDAVIYRSSMMKGDKADNRNIVLLNKGATQAFVGTPTAPLAYASFEAKEVHNVVYELKEAWPF